MIKGRDKRGLSTIVATLLIILLTLVAVGIIWVVVRNVIQGGSEQISLGKFTLDLKISQVQQINDSALNITVKRNAGKGDFVGISFIVEDDSNTEIIKQNVLLQELQTKTYQLYFLTINVSKLKKISIAPIFKLESGKEVNGDVKDTWESSSGISSPLDLYQTANCNDGIQNQGETDVDCGGPCSACVTYLRTFYVSNSGSDSNNGTDTGHSWQTITKVNGYAFLPGDGILFKRGDSWHETLTISRSGNSTFPITFSAYGSGNKPIITGFTTITGWTNEGGGIYSKVITSDAQTNMVTIDGVNIGMGRYPNSTYLTYESFHTNDKIIDNQLTGTPNWTGAEVAIRKNDWTLDRCLITNHTGNTLTYTSLGTNQDGTANYGYFIQNDLRTLDQFGEWYHNIGTGKFYMYFGAVDPTIKVVKVATLNNVLVSNSGADYVTVDGLSFTGSIDNAIYYHWQNDYCVVKNCNITFAGGIGVTLFGVYDTADNNQVSNCNGIGIYSYGTNAVITNNDIKNISLIVGQSKGWLELFGIFVEKNNCLVKNNNIENVGYNGITIGYDANSVTIQNNFINNTCLILDDCGGIYLYGTHSSIVIDSNIIINSIGNTNGAADSNLLSEGIYLDESADHVTVTNNTVADCSSSGIKLHKANNNIIEDNTLFNNYAGINFESHIASSTIYGNVINRNIFFAKASTQLALRFISATNDIPSFGTADNNYYARPIDDNLIMFYYQPNISYAAKTFAQWKTFTSQDVHSHTSPKNITNVNDILFEYNPTRFDKVVALSGNYIDVKNVSYSGSVTLKPYTSIVLIKN